MVVEKLKEREDKRDAQQDERNLINENERLKAINAELIHENDKLSISLKNAQEQYLVSVGELKEANNKIDLLLSALKTLRSQINTFLEL